jgi:glutamate--cysteine ligase catalytic subunit
VGTPQPWPVSKKNLNYVREAGVRQFISTYNRVKDLKGDELMWGDEIEYGIFILEELNGVKKVRLSLRAKEVSCKLQFALVNVPHCLLLCRETFKMKYLIST